MGVCSVGGDLGDLWVCVVWEVTMGTYGCV